MQYHSSSLLERLLGACVTLLLAAAAVHIAARLIAAVWPVLVGIAVAVAAVAGMLAVLRWHRQRW